MQSSDKNFLNKTLTSEILTALQDVLFNELFPIASSTSDANHAGSIGGAYEHIDVIDMKELFFAVRKTQNIYIMITLGIVLLCTILITFI